MAWMVIAGLIALPVLEIALFIKSAGWIGLFPTIAIAIGAGIIGLWMVRSQGLSNSLKMKAQLEKGEMPLTQMFDSACLAVAGFLLLLPGFFSDVVALLLLLPPVRSLIRVRMFKNAVVRGQQQTPFGQGPFGQGPQSGRDGVIDGDYTVITPDDGTPSNGTQNNDWDPKDPPDRLNPPKP